MIKSIVVVALVAYAMPATAVDQHKPDSSSILAHPIPQAKASGSTSLKRKADGQQINAKRAEAASNKADDAKKNSGGPASGDATRDSVKKTLDQQQQMKAYRF